MSLTLRNELLMGAEHGSSTAKLWSEDPLDIVRKDRLTGAFNLCYVLYQKAVY